MTTTDIDYGAEDVPAADPYDRYLADLRTHKCSECWDTGISSWSAVKPMQCFSCARRAMGIEPYSIWRAK